jgi:hypothetical protein
MPQRNGQNPIKSGNNFGQGGVNRKEPVNTHGKSGSGSGVCPACKAEVPLKPGFRFSSLKCPACGAAMGKK